MYLYVLNILLLLVVLWQPALSANLPILTVNGDVTCLSQEKRDEVIQIIIASIRKKLFSFNASDLEILNNCGPRVWYQVAHLNMSEPSQQCPPSWREYNTSGVRACGRSLVTTYMGSCSATTYLPSGQYSKVCGRAIDWKSLCLW